MPSTMTISAQTVALLALLVFAIYLVEVLFFWWKNRRTILAQRIIQAEMLQQMRQEFESLKIRLAALESQQEHDSEARRGFVSSDELSTQSHLSPYAQAIQLVSDGADIDEIQRNCGLARGEAELIVALYRSAGKTRS